MRHPGRTWAHLPPNRDRSLYHGQVHPPRRAPGAPGAPPPLPRRATRATGPRAAALHARRRRPPPPPAASPRCRRRRGPHSVCFGSPPSRLSQILLPGGARGRARARARRHRAAARGASAELVPLAEGAACGHARGLTGPSPLKFQSCVIACVCAQGPDKGGVAPRLGGAMGAAIAAPCAARGREAAAVCRREGKRGARPPSTEPQLRRARRPLRAPTRRGARPSWARARVRAPWPWGRPWSRWRRRRRARRS
jgi:hypothetical protein